MKNQVELNLSEKKTSGSGLYSLYIKATEGIGCKVLKNDIMEDAKNEADAEYNILKLAYASGITPKPMGVFKVIINLYGDKKAERWCICMENIQGETLEEYCRRLGLHHSEVVYEGKELSCYCTDAMSDVGIDIGDRHSGNIMVTTDDDDNITKVYCIDFSPDYACA